MTTTKRAYAASTDVGIGRTKDEISEELGRLGAVRRSIAEDDERGVAVVQFERAAENGLMVRYRMVLRLPSPSEDRFHWTPARRFTVDAATARKNWRQECMSKWRALGAYIKGLRVAAEADIAATEEILSAYVVLPNGQTAAEYLAEQLPSIYAARAMPPFLPGVETPERRALIEGRYTIREDSEGE